MGYRHKRDAPVLCQAGIFVIIFYCLFTFISWAYYPSPCGPMTHYLSYLGNKINNPKGGYLCNYGCILTGPQPAQSDD